ncbi:MAG: YHS domain-containing (seleno)protein [Saprospiraceae bacterium]
MKSLLIPVLLMLFSACNSVDNASNEAIFTNAEGAINGIDPVAYFTESKPVKGQADITFDWQNATWHFATKENLDLFSKNPENYAPQFGGYCAYGWSDGEGHAAPTEPQAWAIVDGKLYLNYNLDVQKMWKEKQAELIQKANKNYGTAYSNN